jgi:small subunit ribosomal protein S27Ae
MAAPVKKPAAKGAAPAAKKPSYHVAKIYDVGGDTLKRARSSCPKCGPGIYLAKHANRTTCGKCGYTEFTK